MRLCVFFILSLISTFAYSVNPVIEISVSPNSIGTNETAEIRVNIINDKAQEPPTLSAKSDKFEITYRGFIAQRSHSIINGAIESRTINTYSYRFVPKVAGEFTIPAFIIITKQGNRIYSKPSKITVQNIARTKPQTSGGFGFSTNPFSNFFGNQIDSFVQLQVKKVEVPQNTGVLIDLYLYSTDPNFLSRSSELQTARNQQFSGGTIYNISFEGEDNDIITEQFGYTTYYGKVIQKYIAFPLETGKLIIYPPVLFSQRIQQNILGDGLEIYSTPITKSLSYIGNNLKLSHSLSSSNIKVSDETTLTLSIEGDGNVDFFTDPFKTVSISSIFIAEPEISLELKHNNDDLDSYIGMKKTFTYTIIAKEAGEIEFPAIDLNFYTTEAQPTNIIYQPIPLKIRESSALTARSKSFSRIHIESEYYQYFSGTMITIITLLLGILMMMIAFFYEKKQQRLANDPQYARSTNAKNRLKKLLLESEQAIKKQEYRNASRLIRQSILYFCADKFGISNSSSSQEIIQYLENRNINFSGQKGFIQLMSELDFYAFGSTPTETQINNYLNDAYLILEEFSKIKQDS